MRLRADTAPPRVFRSIALQVGAIAALALLAELPRARAAPEEKPPDPPKPERRIRVVRLPPPPKPPAAKAQPAPPKAAPAPPKPAPRPARAVASARPPPPNAAPRPVTEAPRTIIPADSTAVHGVHLRVLVPRTPEELAAHLGNSGGCLVVSRLMPDGAEVLSTLFIEHGRAVERDVPPCTGVPRLLRDSALNAALGDPLGRAGARTGDGSQLVLQVLLSPSLHDASQSALRARFGAVSDEEMSRRAAEASYELTCFAEPSGSLHCQ